MRDGWTKVRILKVQIMKCPECKAMVERGEDQTTHMEAHFPPELELEYEFAPGVKVCRDPSLMTELRNIFRLRPPKEEVKYSAEQVPALPEPEDFETRAEVFREHMRRINNHASHDS